MKVQNKYGQLDEDGTLHGSRGIKYNTNAPTINPLTLSDEQAAIWYEWDKLSSLKMTQKDYDLARYQELKEIMTSWKL